MNRHEARRIVKRRQRRQCFELSHHAAVDSNRFREAASAVDDPMADSVQPMKIDVIEQALNGVAVSAYVGDAPGRLIIPLYDRVMADAAHRTAENGRQLDRARRGRRAISIDESKFQGGAAAVQNKEAHARCPMAASRVGTRALAATHATTFSQSAARGSLPDGLCPFLQIGVAD